LLENLAIETDAGFMVACADMPLVKPELINNLIEFYQNNSADIIVPVYGNKHGFPRILHRDYAMRIISQGPGEYHRFLKISENGAMKVEMGTDTVLRDIDTLDAYYVSLFL
jgi:CTP:molybdopterin cytidylyltransferase MocA